jgi:hypothetical protein
MADSLSTVRSGLSYSQAGFGAAAKSALNTPTSSPNGTDLALRASLTAGNIDVAMASAAALHKVSPSAQAMSDARQLLSELQAAQAVGDQSQQHLWEQQQRELLLYLIHCQQQLNLQNYINKLALVSKLSASSCLAAAGQSSSGTPYEGPSSLSAASAAFFPASPSLEQQVSRLPRSSSVDGKNDEAAAFPPRAHTSPSASSSPVHADKQARAGGYAWGGSPWAQHQQQRQHENEALESYDTAGIGGNSLTTPWQSYVSPSAFACGEEKGSGRFSPRAVYDFDATYDAAGVEQKNKGGAVAAGSGANVALPSEEEFEGYISTCQRGYFQ